MTIDLSGRTALVSGATSGLGRATATLLASHGARVFATGRDSTRGADLSDEIARAGGACTFIRADLAVRQQIEELLEELDEHDAEVDVLVNNAGVTTMVTTEATTDEMYQEMFDVNVRAPMLLVQHLVPAMAARVAHVHREHAARSPGRSVGRPDDVAAAIVFLASDDAHHIHGVSVPVDGGVSASA